MLLSEISQKNFSKMRKLPPNAVSLNVLVLRVNDPIGKGPTSFSVVSLEEKTLTYQFCPPSAKSKNLLQSAPPGEVSRTIPAGESSFYVSMFNAPKIKVGMTYQLAGLMYEMYKLTEFDLDGLGNPTDVKTIPRPSFSCKQISPFYVTYETAMRSIPFPNRSFDVERDVPGADRSIYLEAPKNIYRFVYIKVGPEDGDDMVYGRFSPPEIGEVCVTSFTPYSEKGDNKAILALTGGRKMIGNKETVVDNQFMLQQNEAEKEPIVIVGQTKLYEDSLAHLQTDWVKLGPTLIPFLEGDVFAQVNREKTSELLLEDSEVKGMVALSCTFIPQLSKMMKRCGFKLSWESCKLLSPKLVDTLVVSEAPVADFSLVDSINLLQYTGDISLLPKAEEKGWVEFYAVTNRPFAKRMDLKNKPEDVVLAELLNDDFYLTGPRFTAIYAMVTEASPCSIKDFVSTKGKPAAKSHFEENKRTKLVL
jgi:hypothetical protein